MWNSIWMKLMRYVNREVKGASHRSKDMINIAEPLQMIHMDFYGSVNGISTTNPDIFLR